MYCIWFVTFLYTHLESNHKLLSISIFLTLKKSSKETTEAITIEAITQEATRMKVGILFLLFARSCLSDPLPLSRVCPKGWLQNGLGHCFLFGSAGIGSWAEAKEYCKEKGGFLAEIPNEQINSYLYDNIKTNSNLQKKWWWIGANDIANVSLIF